jgi:hypothetical protein
MKSVIGKILSAGALFALTVSASAQAHGHLYLGASSTNWGAQLIFDNAPAFVTSSGYVKTLLFTNASTYSNLFHGNITLTGLRRAPGSDFGVNAAANGSWLHASIVSVEGPAGGEFAFWENLSTTPTISVPCGGTSTNLIRVSESAGAAGSDPYGHIHGRRFTATKPGLYVVRFKAWDISTNGLGGGPIHTPSAELPVYFQAGVVCAITRSNGLANIRYGTFANWDFTVESTTNLLATNSWSALAPARSGNDYFHAAHDTNVISGQKSYRVRAVPTHF